MKHNELMMQRLGAMTDLPIRSRSIAMTEFIEITDSSVERVTELVEMEWLHPVRTADEAFIFGHMDAYKLRKLERLCADFELHTLAGAIIVDLLEKIDTLEKQLRQG